MAIFIIIGGDVCMSITNIKSSYDILGALQYQQEKNGVNRCAAISSNVAPFSFYNFARMMLESTSRKVQGYTIIQAFSPDELAPTPENVELVNLIGCELAARAFGGCPWQVITHTDSKSGHLHNHIAVLNHDLDSGKCITKDCRWLHLSKVNDKLMEDFDLEVCNARTRNADQKAYFDRQREPDKYIWQEDLTERVNRALSGAISPKDFASRLKAEDVTAKIYGKSGKPLKHMVFIFNDKDNIQRRKRGDNMKLDTECTYQALMEHFSQNAAKEKANTQEFLMQKSEMPKRKAHSSEERQKEIEAANAISKAKEEKKKKERIRNTLLEMQRRDKARQEEIERLEKELDYLNELMENISDTEELEQQMKKEQELQQRIKALHDESRSFIPEKKRLMSLLDDKKITLDSQLLMGMEIHKQKQNDFVNIF